MELAFPRMILPPGYDSPQRADRPSICRTSTRQVAGLCRGCHPNARPWDRGELGAVLGRRLDVDAAATRYRRCIGAGLGFRYRGEFGSRAAVVTAGGGAHPRRGARLLGRRGDPGKFVLPLHPRGARSRSWAGGERRVLSTAAHAFLVRQGLWAGRGQGRHACGGAQSSCVDDVLQWRSRDHWPGSGRERRDAHGRWCDGASLQRTGARRSAVRTVDPHGDVAGPPSRSRPGVSLHAVAEHPDHRPSGSGGEQCGSQCSTAAPCLRPGRGRSRSPDRTPSCR